MPSPSTKYANTYWQTNLSAVMHPPIPHQTYMYLCKHAINSAPLQCVVVQVILLMPKFIQIHGHALIIMKFNLLQCYQWHYQF